MMFRNGGNGIGNCLGGNCFQGGYGLMHNGGGMIIMLVITLLLVGAIIFLATRTANRPKGDAALETLKMRFAAGEITEEEYQRNKMVLK